MSLFSIHFKEEPNDVMQEVSLDLEFISRYCSSYNSKNGEVIESPVRAVSEM
jgi:hypothetical protein